MLRKFIICLSICFIFSCSPLHVPKNPIQVSIDRIYRQNILHKKENRNIKITIIRDTGHLGSGMGILFKIDKQKICELYDSEKIEFFLKKGKYLFTTEVGDRGFGSYETFNEEYFDISEDITLRLTILDYGKTQLLNYTR